MPPGSSFWHHLAPPLRRRADRMSIAAVPPRREPPPFGMAMPSPSAAELRPCTLPFSPASASVPAVAVVMAAELAQLSSKRRGSRRTTCEASIARQMGQDGQEGCFRLGSLLPCAHATRETQRAAE